MPLADFLVPTFGFPDPKKNEKLAELIIYISGKCEGDLGFDDAKLGMILWLADTQSFKDHGKPITGVAYQRTKE